MRASAGDCPVFSRRESGARAEVANRCRWHHYDTPKESPVGWPPTNWPFPLSSGSWPLLHRPSEAISHGSEVILQERHTSRCILERLWDVSINLLISVVLMLAFDSDKLTDHWNVTGTFCRKGWESFAHQKQLQTLGAWGMCDWAKVVFH